MNLKSSGLLGTIMYVVSSNEKINMSFNYNLIMMYMQIIDTYIYIKFDFNFTIIAITSPVGNTYYE